MFEKYKYDHVAVKEIWTFYVKYQEILNKFSEDIGISSRILGNYDESKEIDLHLKLIESYMATMMYLIVSIGNFRKKDYIEYIFDICKERQLKLNHSLESISGFEEIIISDPLKMNISEMMKSTAEFLKNLQNFFYKLGMR